VEAHATASLDEDSVCALDDPNEGEDGEYKGRPVDKAGAGLLGEDGEQGPCDGDGRGEIALGGGEGVGGGSAFEEEEGKEDEDFCPDASAGGEGVDTECLEGGNDDEDGRPAVVEREGKVDEYLVAEALSEMVFFDNVVDVLSTRNVSCGPI
jgi:hypothetical protein